MIDFRGSICRTGCSAPGTHRSWGECFRAAGVQVDLHGLQNRNLELDKDRRLSAYEASRREGGVPSTTSWKDIRHAQETGGEPATSKRLKEMEF